MWWDNKFTLREDGDTLERLWWPLLSHYFPQYERFWIRHIVPLTNRIDPDFSNQREDWFAFRTDPKIGAEVERMAMAQYSTFYFIARSALIINYEPHLYVEDAFLFLDLAIKNARSFLRIWRKELAGKLGLASTSFPNHNRMFNRPFATETREYRDVVAHAPKIGKPLSLSREFLPKRTHLAQAEWSWRYVQALPDSSFEEGRTLLRRLLADFLREVGEAWSGVESAIETRRASTEYRSCFNLDNNDCIRGKKPSR
jgi:hypothetical protein